MRRIADRRAMIGPSGEPDKISSNIVLEVKAGHDGGEGALAATG